MERSKPERSDLGSIREERRALLATLQSDYLRMLGKDTGATEALGSDAIAKLRKLANRMEKARHQRAPVWESTHLGVLKQLHRWTQDSRLRRLDSENMLLPPRPVPEDYFGDPSEGLPDFGQDEVLCSVTTTRIETSANHGATVETAPQDSGLVSSDIQFNPIPGQNEVKMTVGIETESQTSDVAVTADAAWRFDFRPQVAGLHTVRPLAFLNGSWLLWTSNPGLLVSSAQAKVVIRVRVSQFDGLTLFETAEHSILEAHAADENLDSGIYYDSVTSSAPLELPVQLAKNLRTHIIVGSTVSLRLIGAGLAGVNFSDQNYYFRVPEVQIDRFDCQGFLPSECPGLTLVPSYAALRKNDTFQFQILADLSSDGEVQVTSSNPSAVSVSTPGNMQAGAGSATATAREENREARITASRSGHRDGNATVYVENSQGVWTERSVINGFVAVHSALLPSGKVLMFSASHESHGDLADIDKGKSFLWNYENDAVEEVPIFRNLFCSGHCQLGDGRLLVAGGQNLWQLSPRALLGLVGGTGADKDIHTFDPVHESWSRHADMPDKRWYPTCVTLPNGNGLVVGGLRYDTSVYREHNKTRETFRIQTNSLSDAKFFRDSLLYPFLQVLPGGFVFVFRRRHANHFDLDADDWLRKPDGSRLSFRTEHSGRRTYPGQGCCVPLTIDAADPSRTLLMVVGGSQELDDISKDSLTTNSVEVFEFRRNDPPSSLWREVAPLPDQRFMCDGVLLADGSVFVTNGAGKGTADDSSTARLASYIFEPWNNAWFAVGDSLRPRTYHSTALLLPDGKVLVAGSTGPDLLDHRQDEFHIDVFTPPYLTRGPRPMVEEAPEEIEFGEDFALSVRGSSASQIVEVALVRPGSTTHSVNMDQRRVRLTILERSGNRVQVTAPTDGSIAPKGSYMLFALNNFGVPSVAKFVALR
jgi:hypothetical protein